MKTVIDWTNTKNPLPIVMTVALPVFNAKNIIWLPLESLRLQEDIDFGWELIIMEEHAESLEMVKSFIGKFPNCQRIVMISVDPKVDGRKSGQFRGKFILIDKWLHIANVVSSKESKIFVQCDADDYNNTKRLSIHHKHFQNQDCSYSTMPVGLFIDLTNHNKAFYDGYYKQTGKVMSGAVPICSNHLNKAVRMNLIRQIRSIERNRGIDTHIRTSIEKLPQFNSKNPCKLYSFDSVDNENWKTGIFTDGANNISRGRKQLYNKKGPPFLLYSEWHEKKFKYMDMNHYLPPQVVEFLLTYADKYLRK